MLDLVAIVSLTLVFGLAVVYVHGCDRLKGTRPMILNVILLVLSALLMVYLVLALLRPEKF